MSMSILCNAIYVGIVVPAEKSPDGESPEQITVTEEVNGYAIWRESHDGRKMIHFTLYRSERNRFAAIETAVRLADADRVRDTWREKEGS